MSAPGDKSRGDGQPPQVADHLVLRRIGRGSYGEVWLARNILGFHRAVKVVFRRNFQSDAPFEREFNGILNYEPVSRAHPGHVDILQVGRNDAAGCFYYVMELADDANGGRPASPEVAATPDAPAPVWLDGYVPRTLKTELDRRGRLPAAECIELGIALANALDHLHRCGLVHRDVKPANVIFIAGHPELADIGLVTGSDQQQSQLGTHGYLPTEGAGTPAGDVYALGKVLYELGTGLDRKRFPELPAELGEWPDRATVLRLMKVCARACDPKPDSRYPSAAALLADLTAARDPAAHQPIGSSRRPRRTGRLLAGTVLIAAVVALGTLARRHFRSTPPVAPAAPSQTQNAERPADGFRDLVTANALDYWRHEGMGTNAAPQPWAVEDGALVRRDTGATNWSRLIYDGPPLPRDFELRFDWKVAPGAQGGVFYLPGFFKYHLIDGGLPAAQKASVRPGSLFSFRGPNADLSRPAGEWNEARIVRRGAIVEHWLNGQLAARLDFNDATTRTEHQASEARHYGQKSFGDPVARRPQLRLLECGAPLALRGLKVSAAPPEPAAGRTDPPR